MENGEIGGIATDIIKKVLNEMQVNYHIEIYPWARAQAMVKNGEADAFYSASRNATRDNYAVISDTVAPQKWYWYLQEDSQWNPNSSDFVNNAGVAALFGSNMFQYLQKYNYKINGNAYNMDVLIKMFHTKKVDAILVNDDVAIKYFKANQIFYEKYNKVLFKNKPLGIYFSKKFLKENQGFLEEFNKVLKKYSIEN
jgi:polar amino acid transport system substrate-binding protein